MIKVEHTLFALPFAFLGMLLAAEGWPSWRTVLWTAVAMVGARSAAMGFNRLVDRKIDAANPRTARRALPAGLVTPAAVTVFVATSAALLILAAWQLNPLALALSPVALFILFLYSHTKRFTWASHLVLGLSLAGAPLGAWIAVRGDVKATPLILAGVVLSWVAGFDVMYALQDVDFDRDSGLYSIPARFGVVGALRISAGLHACTLILLALLPRIREKREKCQALLRLGAKRPRGYPSPGAAGGVVGRGAGVRVLGGGGGEHGPVRGKTPVVFRQRLGVRSQRSVVSSQWSVVSGQRFAIRRR